VNRNAHGFVSGFTVGPRWVLLLAPVLNIGGFELARQGASGPTVDGISTDGMFGILAFIVSRGFCGLVGVLPMLVASAYGAGLARRLAPTAEHQRRLRSGIALYLRRGITALAALAVLGLVWLWCGRRACRQSATRAARRSPGSIASLENVRINSSEQWIEIRAWSPDKPVLLSIPGGPGQSDLALSRPTLGTLAKDFVVVSWDQRGGGKSYASYDPKTLTTKQAVADTISLTNILDEASMAPIPALWVVAGRAGTKLGVRSRTELAGRSA
jgi:proline iminopeptidase